MSFWKSHAQFVVVWVFCNNQINNKCRKFCGLDCYSKIQITFKMAVIPNQWTKVHYRGKSTHKTQSIPPTQQINRCFLTLKKLNFHDEKFLFFVNSFKCETDFLYFAKINDLINFRFFITHWLKVIFFEYIFRDSRELFEFEFSRDWRPHVARLKVNRLKRSNR